MQGQQGPVLDAALLQRQVAGQQVTIAADDPVRRLVVAGTSRGACLAAADIHQLKDETRYREVARKGHFATSRLTIDRHEKSLRAHGYTP